ncbi:MAG: hypothetical protein KH230_03160 [Enterocloster asparagiformis]|nr:hypothetical protein [Enterocloster asparagiformis]
MKAAARRKRAFPPWLGKKQVCCVLAGLLLGGMAQAAAAVGTDGRAGELRRPGYGQDEVTRRVIVEGLLAEAVPVEIHMAGREYGADEIGQVYERILEELPERIRGDNPSLKEVRGDLDLITRVDEYGIRLRWESEDGERVDAFGSVNADGAPESGTEVALLVELTDGRYPQQFVLPVRVLPQKADGEQEAVERFVRAVEEADRGQRETPWLKLPETYQGVKLRYREPEEAPFKSLAALGIAAAALVTVKERSDREKAARQRENQLLMDYPEVVSKLMIFLGAGMTVRTAWERIAGDYREMAGSGKRAVRYVYEEMYETCCQMSRGVPEGQAYAKFGRRCGLLPYMKLCSLLEQNRKNGSKNVRELLRAEMAEAFELRKHGARRMGEEAGTRLLLPLFLMLGVVMVMVAVPAMLEFM